MGSSGMSRSLSEGQKGQDQVQRAQEGVDKILASILYGVDNCGLCLLDLCQM